MTGAPPTTMTTMTGAQRSVAWWLGWGMRVEDGVLVGGLCVGGKVG
jgi:hypothetical protein